MSLLIPIGVSYDSDADEVERILIEEAKNGSRDITGLLAQPEPFVRFIPGFGDSSFEFHAHLPGGRVRRSVPGAARASQTDPETVP
jgi:small-conductance mechanosensitive channel